MDGACPFGLYFRILPLFCAVNYADTALAYFRCRGPFRCVQEADIIINFRILHAMVQSLPCSALLMRSLLEGGALE